MFDYMMYPILKAEFCISLTLVIDETMANRLRPVSIRTFITWLNKSKTIAKKFLPGFRHGTSCDSKFAACESKVVGAFFFTQLSMITLLYEYVYKQPPIYTYL